MKKIFCYFFLLSFLFCQQEKQVKKPNTNLEKDLEKKNTTQKKTVKKKVTKEKTKNLNKTKSSNKTKNIDVNFLDLDYFTNLTMFKDELEKKIKKYNRANDYYQMGVLLLTQKKIKQAEKYFINGQKVLIEKKNLYRYIYAVGYCQYRQKNYKKAEKSMLATIKLEEYLKAFKILTLIYFKQKKYKLAQQNIERIKKYPEFKSEVYWQELEKEIEEILSARENEKK